MSIALMTLAWKSGLPSGQKMVLLALCDNANDQGECYPSVPMLAKKCSMGERSVQRHISDMEAVGILRRELRTGRSTVYHIDPRHFDTPANLAPPPDCHPTPADLAPPPPPQWHPTPATVAPITITEPSVEPSVNQKQSAGKKPPRSVLGVPDLVALGVDKQVAEDWMQIRKVKKLPLTKTALEEFVANVERSGMALPDAVRLCCARGWGGFNPDWLTPRAGAQGSATSDKFKVANLDHSSSRAAMEASIKKHGITLPDDDDDINF